MEGYCAQCQRWFDIELPELDAGLLCPNCLARAGVVRAKKRVAHGRRLKTALRRPAVPPAVPRKPDIG